MARSVKNTADRKKKGTYRKSEDKQVLKSETEGYPDPGLKLTEQQEVIYKRVCEHLMAKQALFDVDTFMIASFAVAVDTRNKAVEMMNALGLIQEFENGTRNISPEFSVFKKANEEMRQLSKMIGGDPRSRQDLTIFLAKEEDSVDPLEEILSQLS